MLKESSWREGVSACCPKCEAPPGAEGEALPECGAAIVQKLHCTECGVLRELRHQGRVAPRRG